MIVYKRSVKDFLFDADSGNIGEIVRHEVHKKLQRRVGDSEQASWHNSLNYMAGVLDKADISEKSVVGIEYNIPRTSNRIDFLITGADQEGQNQLVLIELKQWSSSELTQEEAIVRTYLGRGLQETTHPSYQAWSYAELLRGYNEAVYEGQIGLHPCAFLHNHPDDGVLTDSVYGPYISKAPLFFRTDKQQLRDFLKQHVPFRSKKDLLYEIEHGRIRPSKELADQVVSLLKGNEAFVLIDSQKIAYQRALSFAKRAQASGRKHVLIVKGGPGTGKSVIAIQLLAKLTALGQVAQYVSKNAAPRKVYEAKLTGSFRKSVISNLFKPSGGYHRVGKDQFDTLIIDEAHRLNEKSGLYGNEGENQVKELIQASRCSIFFLDEDQRIHIKDIGSEEEIRDWAEESDAVIQEIELHSQFRCSGSDGYMAWLDNTLEIRTTANPKLGKEEFEFNVLDNPRDLYSLIQERNQERNSARLVAGYCWDWNSKKAPADMDIIIPEHDFAMRWNMEKHGGLWMINPESISEVGCIHTAQGLELDHIGVIIGPDLILRSGKVTCVPEHRSKMDYSIRGWKSMMKRDPLRTKEQIDQIIRNTYRTLMTRGMKSCSIWCADEALAEHFRERMES